MPQWSTPPVEWVNVDIRFAGVRIILEDKDVGNADSIGTVDIDAASLLDATTQPSGRLAFRAAEQTRNQILFVDIAVF